MSIRVATIKDLERIVAFNRQLAWETEDKDLPLERVTKGVRALLEDPSKGTYYVYEVAGEVVGQLMHTYEWSDWRNGMFWWIQSVYVQKDYRQQGVFKQLYSFIREKAQEDPEVCGIRLYVEKENEVAKATYQNLGMEACDYYLYEFEK